jgi:hypothetical protein
LASGGSDGGGGSESGGGAKDGANIAGILDAGENDEERSAGAGGSGEEVFEFKFAGLDEGGYALGMLGVGNAFEEAIGGAKDGEAYVGAADEWGEALAMAFAGFAEEDGFDAAGGAESFFDEADAFDADGTVFGGEAAAESDAELLEPTVVAAGEEVGGGGGFGRGGHGRKGSKCRGWNAIGAGRHQLSDISDQEARESKTKITQRRRVRGGAQREEETKSRVPSRIRVNRGDCAACKRNPRPRHRLRAWGNLRRTVRWGKRERGKEGKRERGKEGKRERVETWWGRVFYCGRVEACDTVRSRVALGDGVAA